MTMYQNPSLKANQTTKSTHDSDESETLTLLKQLVAIPSPYFEEDEIMQFVYEWFEDLNVPVAMHHYTEVLHHQTPVVDYYGKNVIVTLAGSPDEEAPTIFLNAHLDTVQPTMGWTKQMYGEQVGNRFYGLGALDMKSGCVAVMIALKRFSKDTPNFKGKIIATFVSDEEGPFGMGTNALIEEGLLNGIDYVIATEPSAAFNDMDFPNICLGARGGFNVIVEFYGKAAHAANPHMGINTAVDAAKFIPRFFLTKSYHLILPNGVPPASVAWVSNSVTYENIMPNSHALARRLGGACDTQH